jgi:hypothetical protein
VSRRVLVIAALLMVGAVGACSSGAPTKADQGRSIAEDAGLPKDVADFFASAVSPAGGGFRVVYDITDTDGKPSQVTLTQQEPKRRVDVFHADGTIDSTIGTGARNVQCTKTGDTWQCGNLEGAIGAQPSNGVLDTNALSAAAERLRERAADFDFRIDTRNIAGVSARCLVTTRKPEAASDPSLGASGTLCLSSEGALLLGETPTGRFEAKEYSTTIPTDAFDLPAPVS